MEIGLSQYSGMEFLEFFAWLSAAAIAAALWLPNWLRPDGDPGSIQDPQTLAFLAGGAPRHTEAVIAGLMADGSLGVDGDDRLFAMGSADQRKGAAKTVLALPGIFGWNDAAKALRDEARALKGRLVERGLLMERSTALQLRALSVLPLLFVLALGLFRRSAGAALGEPVGYLTLMLFGLGAIALIRFFALDPRTRAGRDAVQEAQDRSSRLRRAPLASETGAAVALFGTAVLVGTPLAPLHAMRTASSGDSGSSSSSDGGGSGCGGGGCGGCGG